MPDPNNYMIQSPMPAFQQAYQFGQQIAAQRKAEQQAQLQQQQAAQAQRDMQMVYDNPTPENISKFYLAYPAYKEQFAAAQAPLNEANKKANLDFSTQAFALLNAGKVDDVQQMVADRVKALRNTPGKEQEAGALEAVAKIIKTDPQAGKQLVGMSIAAMDEGLYKTIFGQVDMTGFQKDLVAAGIDPNSPEGKARATEYVSLKTDPLVEMETPSGSKFIGRQSEYFARYGRNAPAPSVKSVPKPGDVKGDYKFIGGDPAKPENWNKVGGGSGNAAGSFRP